MANVILRDGRVLQYNDVKAISCSANATVLELYGENFDKTEYVIAAFPMDVIERYEWRKPCKTRREYKKKKYPSY